MHKYSIIGLTLEQRQWKWADTAVQLNSSTNTRYTLQRW